MDGRTADTRDALSILSPIIISVEFVIFVALPVTFNKR
jgi:hypothetical protein